MNKAQKKFIRKLTRDVFEINDYVTLLYQWRDQYIGKTLTIPMWVELISMVTRHEKNRNKIDNKIRPCTKKDAISFVRKLASKSGLLDYAEFNSYLMILEQHYLK